MRDKINLICNELPETAEEPIIQKLDLASTPILQIAVSAPLSQRELYDLADKKISDQIKNVSGVGEVTVIGGGERRQLIAGTSTTYLVLERQTNLVQAQATELQAQTDLNKAISNLQRVVGKSLDANGVNVQTEK